MRSVQLTRPNSYNSGAVVNKGASRPIAYDCKYDSGIVRPEINAAPTDREINDRIEARSSNGPVTVVLPQSNVGACRVTRSRARV